MKNIRSFLIVGLCFVGLSLSSCLGIVAGGAAVTGVAASSEGGIKSEYNDLKIHGQINDLWFRSDIDIFRKLDLNVNQGRVLITGVVQDPDRRVEAVRLAWQPAGVKQVINEIRVAESKGPIGYAKDTWITTKLRAVITVDKEVQSLGYSIDTVHGTVYLMGVSHTQTELDHLMDVARNIKGVEQVVSYVTLIGEK